MIPENFIIGWQKFAPWQDYSQVEQDLILSRVLAEIFSDNILKKTLLFRGGTALNKLYMKSPVRYSEDLDFVMIKKGPIGPVYDSLREKFDKLFEKTDTGRGESMATMTFYYKCEFPPPVENKVKLEINYLEDFIVADKVFKKYTVVNPWFSGNVNIPTYTINELLATKLRALFQRNKGRDLFDLWKSVKDGLVEEEKVVNYFKIYTEKLDIPITKARFEKNLSGKYKDKDFKEDIKPLLAKDVDYDIEEAFKVIHAAFISKLKGSSYSGDDNIY